MPYTVQKGIAPKDILENKPKPKKGDTTHDRSPLQTLQHSNRRIQGSSPCNDRITLQALRHSDRRIQESHQHRQSYHKVKKDRLTAVYVFYQYITTGIPGEIVL